MIKFKSLKQMKELDRDALVAYHNSVLDIYLYEDLEFSVWFKMSKHIESIRIVMKDWY
jgi:hypothetical protein